MIIKSGERCDTILGDILNHLNKLRNVLRETWRNIESLKAVVFFFNKLKNHFIDII